MSIPEASVRSFAANSTTEERWDYARTQLLATPLADLTFVQLSETHKIKWPATRREETLSKYLQLPLAQLEAQRGFGRQKIENLCSLVSALAASLPLAIAKMTPEIKGPPISSIPEVSTPSELQTTLRQLGVPETMPLSVTFLSSRVKDFAILRGCNRLFAFTEYLAGNDKFGDLKHRNFGRSSFQELRRFEHALRTRHLAELRKFLPLGATNGRPDLGVLTRMEAESHANVKTSALRERLFLGRTLQEVAELTGVTRERVRQVEKLLLAAIVEFLGCMPELKNELWQTWSTQRGLRDVPSDEPVEIRELAAGAVARIFEESREGQQQEADIAQSVAELLDLLADEPAFYVGLKLDEFLDTNHAPLPVGAALYETIKKHPRIRFDTVHGKVWANNSHAKPFAAALLRRGVTQSTDILDWLRQSPEHAMTPATLRRNWSLWKSDPDFPSVPITFPVPATLAGASTSLRKEALVVPAVPSALSRVAPILSISPELADLDRQLIEIISRQSGAVICGLLPVPDDFHLRTQVALQSYCAGDVEKLETVFAAAPAAAVYGVVATLASTMNGLAVWEPLATGLGVAIPIHRRISIAREFRAALRETGLIDCPKPLAPTGDPEDSGGAWSIIAQAGIVPQFVEGFAEVMRLELAEGAAPNLADESSLQHFTLKLARRLPVTKRRLRHVLVSAVGAAVCRTVLHAFQSGNLHALPAPWREHFRTTLALWGVHRQDATRPPTFRFSPELGLYHELPPQPEKIRRVTSHWLVDTTATKYPADEMVRLRAAILPVGVNTITLEQLELEQSNAPDFQLPVGPNTEDPVLVFTSPAGKWVRNAVSSDGTIELPVGRDYFLVMAEDAVSDLADESWSVTDGGQRWVCYNSCWNQITITISSGTAIRRIIPRRGISLLLQTGAGGSRLLSDEGQVIYAGDSLAGGIVLADRLALGAIPTQLEVPELGVSCIGLAAQPTEDPEGTAYAALPEEVVKALAAVPPGIHALTFVVHGLRRAQRQTVYYWKGLQYVSPDEGFVCRGLANVDVSGLRGLRPVANGLSFDSKDGPTTVEIALLNPPDRLSLARPGLNVELLQDSVPECDVAAGSTLRVPADDQRIVRFNAHLSAAGLVLVEGRPWRRFEAGTSRHTTRLISLLPPGAPMATVVFEYSDGRQTKLFRVVRERVLNQIWFDDDPLRDCYYLRLGLAREADAGEKLAVTAHDLLRTATAETLVVPFPTSEGHHAVDGAGGLAIAVVVKLRAHERIVELFIPRAAFAGRFVVLELVFQTPDGDWAPLLATSGHEPGVARWIAHDGEVLSTTPLASLLSQKGQRKNSTEPIFTVPEWADAIARLRPLIHQTYAHPFWEHLQIVKRSYLALGRIALPAELVREAVFDLAHQSGVNEVRFRPILFATQVKLVTSPARLFQLSSFPLGPIGRCFERLGYLASTVQSKKS